ncbi:hypothetical protein LINPERHAP2_LOCUS3791 [Linum perenne]
MPTVSPPQREADLLRCRGGVRYPAACCCDRI